MNASSNLKLRVGALILLAALLFAGLVFLLADVQLGGQRSLQVAFADSSGVQAGAPVRLAGLRVGRVQGVRLLSAAERAQLAQRWPQQPSPNVVFTVGLQAEAFALLDPQARWLLTTQSVLGETYIEIVPGQGEPGLEAEAVLRGQDLPRFDQLLSRTDRVLGQVEALLSEGERLPLTETFTQLQQLIGRLHGLLERHDGALGRSLEALPALLEGGADLTQRLRTLLGADEDLHGMRSDLIQILRATAPQVGPLFRELRQLIGGAQALVQLGQSLLEPLQRLDPQLAVRLTDLLDGGRELLRHAQPALERLAAVAHDAHWLTDRLRRGEGTLGAFMRDQEIYDDLKAMLKDLKRNPWKFIWKE